MLQKELGDTLKNRRTIIFAAFMIIIMLIDLYMVCDNDKLWYKKNHEAEILEMDKIMSEIDDCAIWVSGWIMHPAKASFLFW